MVIWGGGETHFGSVLTGHMGTTYPPVPLYTDRYHYRPWPIPSTTDPRTKWGTVSVKRIRRDNKTFTMSLFQIGGGGTVDVVLD